MATSSTSIHILIIPSWYPLTPTDINGSFFREQAIALKKVGHNVGVITPCLRSLRQWKNIFKFYGVENKLDEGVPTLRFHSVNFTPKIDFFAEKLWVYLGLFLFKKYVETYGKPDIIHVHSLDKGALLALEIYKKFKIPYIVTEHSSAFAKNLISDKKKTSLYPAVMAAKSKIAVSQSFANLLNKTFLDSNWVYIPNIVSEKFMRLVPLIREKDKEFTFVNVCLLTENKRVDLLIKAFAQLVKVHRHLRLEIGGDGACRPMLEDLASQLGLMDKIKFLGALSREQVASHIQHADAFVLASEYETFGVVLVEALALGKPVIATRCGGPESIVTDRVGVLVAKNSVEELYDGMLKVYLERFNYDAGDIKSYCVDNFSESSVTAKLTKVYQHVIQESAGVLKENE